MTPHASLVVCAGIPRSGSTWLYNAIRLLLQHEHGERRVYGAWVDRYDATNASRWHVVKIHDPSEPLAWRAKCVVTSRRDLRDIAASAWKRGWVSDNASTLALLDSIIAQHAFWRPRAAHEMVYERMRSNAASELECLAGALGMSLSQQGILATIAAIDSLGHDDASADDFDSANLMHKKHIMDGRVGYHAQTLPPDLVATINDRYRAWLLTHGYITN
jgi:hypothetical protein